MFGQMWEKDSVCLGGDLSLDQFMQVVRFGAEVVFAEEYRTRVIESRALIEKWVQEERVIYGTTTGFGKMVSSCVKKEEAEKLQHNIIVSHATSVGEPMTSEMVRAVMLMVLQNLGKGLSGVRLEVLERYRAFLNRNLIPFVPQHGSVGYLCPEAHIAMVLIGKGKAYWEGELYDGEVALKKAGISPISLSYKEGLAIVSGATSVTAISAIAEYDLRNAAETADVVAAISFEVLGGQLRAFDERVMRAKPHKQMEQTANHMKRLLRGSEIILDKEGKTVQDALSLRCIPQIHGAAKKTIEDAAQVVEIELNACNDNPLVCEEEDDGTIVSNGNPDSSFLGIEMDSVCIAATTLAKISERRNVRLIDRQLSGLPSFLANEPGLNSGLMIPQYTQAALLNEMRVLATPSSVDSVTTSANQEDVVSMAYNAGLKAMKSVEKLEYVLAIELLSGYQAQQFLPKDKKRGIGTDAVLRHIAKNIPLMKQDQYLYPHMAWLREAIHHGKIVQLAETADPVK